MAMLHIIRCSGFSSNALSQCLDITLPNDSILLMDDGCYNLHHPLLIAAKVERPELKIFFIDVHANARALSNNSHGFIPSTLAEMLKLIFNHNNSITWS